MDPVTGGDEAVDPRFVDALVIGGLVFALLAVGVVGGLVVWAARSGGR